MSQEKPNKVVVVSEDSDILYILTALASTEKENYFLKPSRNNGKQKVPQDIFTSNCLNDEYSNSKDHILFLHAFTGCDTTSVFHKKSIIL